MDYDYLSGSFPVWYEIQSDYSPLWVSSLTQQKSRYEGATLLHLVADGRAACWILWPCRKTWQIWVPQNRGSYLSPHKHQDRDVSSVLASVIVRGWLPILRTASTHSSLQSEWIIEEAAGCFLCVGPTFSWWLCPHALYLSIVELPSPVTR